MDTLNEYRSLVEAALTEQTRVPFSRGDIGIETVFDREADRYLVMLVGYNAQQRRVHGCLVHVDILDGKLWIQRDGTENGVANDFLEAGIPKDRIVLAFHSPAERQHTEFAVA